MPSVVELADDASCAALAIPKSVTSTWPSCRQEVVALHVAVDDAVEVRVGRARPRTCRAMRGGVAQREALLLLEQLAERRPVRQRMRCTRLSSCSRPTL